MNGEAGEFGCEAQPSTSGFGKSLHVQVCTKGIWLWGEPVYVDNKKMAVLFLAGRLGSVKASATQDARIFALTLLIASYFVYNSRGTIDSSAIDKLSLVVNLTKQIQFDQQQMEKRLTLKNCSNTCHHSCG